MASKPRIITVDPAWNISRIVSSAINLLDRSVIQVDVPDANDALEELERGCNLVVSAFEIDDDMKGFEFALRVKKQSPETSVIILGDLDDPDDMDEETALDSPFVYLSRPFDMQKLLRVLVAGLEGHDAMMSALNAPAGGQNGMTPADLGPVPTLDVNRAQQIVDSLLTELGAMAIIFASRAGEVILERGAVGYIDREALTQALLPIIMTNINVKDLVGGQINTVQFYDGEDYDIFVLSVGLHHFMCMMFDGQQGARQFGLVNRFGRRAVEDMIALLGANAFFIQPPAQPEPREEKRRPAKRATQEKEAVTLEKAHLTDNIEEEVDEPEPEIQLDPIQDLDLDLLFDDQMDTNSMDDLFDPEKLEELAKESTQQTGKFIDRDQARQLGIVD